KSASNPSDIKKVTALVYSQANVIRNVLATPLESHITHRPLCDLSPWHSSPSRTSPDWTLSPSQQDDDFTDNPEPMDEEEQERLYSHWQAVASTHQVSVPREMTGPIQEMTRQNQQQEAVPFATVSQHEKLGSVAYEDRVYPAGKWACITRGEELYEQSISMAFMKLMRYICKENSTVFQNHSRSHPHLYPCPRGKEAWGRG
ncbi:hypothetical protein AAFF_G00255540, partial [Aldrovandia affinis]